MDEPLDAFAGFLLLGFAVLLGYATWKHVPGGAIGLLKQAVTTGRIGTAQGQGSSPKGSQPKQQSSGGGLASDAGTAFHLLYPFAP